MPYLNKICNLRSYTIYLACIVKKGVTMKFNLNLSEYQPYKTMGRSCQLKDIMEYHIY